MKPEASWIRIESRLPPVGDRVECLLHYIPCPYFVEIGIQKVTDEKYSTGFFYRKLDKKMSLGYIWTDGVGTPSSNVIAWRTIS
jgi:hypothetical protein